MLIFKMHLAVIRFSFTPPFNCQHPMQSSQWTTYTSIVLVIRCSHHSFELFEYSNALVKLPAKIFGCFGWKSYTWRLVWSNSPIYSIVWGSSFATFIYIQYIFHSFILLCITLSLLETFCCNPSKKKTVEPSQRQLPRDNWLAYVAEPTPPPVLTSASKLWATKKQKRNGTIGSQNQLWASCACAGRGVNASFGKSDVMLFFNIFHWNQVHYQFSLLMHFPTYDGNSC